ncbi:helix-turn-helix domain-containing protein [Kitasatospora purpeofusca]|uniref:helix-turn-helix domain-containing protein n=1 Tax=Kitasatospora purpeofusca TaxID=67352 RepID=UPI002251C68D|nr:helix-turn-helix transcriptional regulator [Kitasatospora purpeofusca]MCX4752187.1 helix-turn-helix domain-containing protein [Kitasatospora purpeofusca]WSR31779.1 helix-turn-helix domain-containing protein [Kitasatospora purpeofusca]
MSDRTSWRAVREEILGRPGAGAAHGAACIRFELGEAVRLRREALGMTQAKLAAACGMQQSAVARFETGGTMPTIVVLERLVSALGMRLTVEPEPLDRAG